MHTWHACMHACMHACIHTYIHTVYIYTDTLKLYNPENFLCILFFQTFVASSVLRRSGQLSWRLQWGSICIVFRVWLKHAQALFRQPLLECNSRSGHCCPTCPGELPRSLLRRSWRVLLCASLHTDGDVLYGSKLGFHLLAGFSTFLLSRRSILSFWPQTPLMSIHIVWTSEVMPFYLSF